MLLFHDVYKPLLIFLLSFLGTRLLSRLISRKSLHSLWEFNKPVYRHWDRNLKWWRVPHSQDYFNLCRVRNLHMLTSNPSSHSLSFACQLFPTRPSSFASSLFHSPSRLLSRPLIQSLTHARIQTYAHNSYFHPLLLLYIDCLSTRLCGLVFHSFICLLCFPPFFSFLSQSISLPYYSQHLVPKFNSLPFFCVFIFRLHSFPTFLPYFFPRVQLNLDGGRVIKKLENVRPSGPIPLDGTLYVGGLEPGMTIPLAVPVIEPFVGDMKEVVVNGQ